MTRKDYKALAEILGKVGGQSQQHGEIVAEAVARLSEYFQADNPRFDPKRFRDEYMMTLWAKQSVVRATAPNYTSPEGFISWE
jgi:hypothetical protein